MCNIFVIVIRGITPPAERNVQLPVPSPDKGGGLASGAARLKTPWQINHGVQYSS